jgi:hypothetical protein
MMGNGSDAQIQKLKQLAESWVLKTKRFSARSSPIPIPGLKGHAF